MNVKRTQVERSEATRAALVDAARALFGERGYGDVGTEEIVARAGVTRGALYHQFADKQDLFRAVFDAVEEEVIAARRRGGAGEGIERRARRCAATIGAWLDVCEEPGRPADRAARRARRSWAGRSGARSAQRYGLGEAMALLEAAMEAGDDRAPAGAAARACRRSARSTRRRSTSRGPRTARPRARR